MFIDYLAAAGVQSAMVEHTPHDLEVLGTNPAVVNTTFWSLLFIYFPHKFSGINQVPQGGALLVILWKAII